MFPVSPVLCLTSVNEGSGFQMPGVRALLGPQIAAALVVDAIGLKAIHHVVRPRDVMCVEEIGEVRPRVVGPAGTLRSLRREADPAGNRRR